MRRWVLLIEPLLLLKLARGLLRVLAVATLARAIGMRLGEGAAGDPRETSAAVAESVGRRIAAASALLAQHDDCLPQAFAAGMMLRLRGVRASLHIGVLKRETLSAHAWLSVGPVVVVGGGQRWAYRELGGHC